MFHVNLQGCNIFWCFYVFLSLALKASTLLLLRQFLGDGFKQMLSSPWKNWGRLIVDFWVVLVIISIVTGKWTRDRIRVFFVIFLPWTSRCLDLLGCPWKWSQLVRKLVYNLFTGRIQPTYVGVKFPLILSTSRTEFFLGKKTSRFDTSPFFFPSYCFRPPKKTRPIFPPRWKTPGETAFRFAPSCGKHLNSKLTMTEKARLYAFSQSPGSSWNAGNTVNTHGISCKTWLNFGEFCGCYGKCPYICKNDPNWLAHILRRVVQPPATFGVESHRHFVSLSVLSNQKVTNLRSSNILNFQLNPSPFWYWSVVFSGVIQKNIVCLAPLFSVEFFSKHIIIMILLCFIISYPIIVPQNQKERKKKRQKTKCFSGCRRLY